MIGILLKVPMLNNNSLISPFFVSLSLVPKNNTAYVHLNTKDSFETPNLDSIFLENITRFNYQKQVNENL
ncbi:hypothetical protein RND71_018613 [Anisodus tanguticus]|uniref:Uncharacterized protein n=1 Tax=Anisodus tanguticus TaxID=243964 RepID=A0AAE1S545_9SOLA|nr:hypothetical protein RND71_018613 [Anisodus tanguticus]